MEVPDETGFNGAADFHRRKYSFTNAATARMAWLQWGRRFSSAEMAYRYNNKKIVPASFNGAADFHRRKSSRAEPVEGYTPARFNGAADFHRRK